MALLQEIQVPLLAVNDTSLTVVEIAFSSGRPVKKGDCIMTFETSKTTYDVVAEVDGYIQYLCEIDRDYEVNQVVARIYSEIAEAQTPVPAPPAPAPGRPAPATGRPATAPPATPRVKPAAAPRPGVTPPAGGQYAPTPGQHAAAPILPDGSPTTPWEGETQFSQEATFLLESSGIDKSLFAGKDFVSKSDVLDLLQPNLFAPSAWEPDPSAPAGQPDPSALSAAREPTPTPARLPKTAPTRAILPVDPASAIASRLSSGKKREIEYLAEVQSTGLTSTIHSYVETEGLFTHINRSLQYLKDSILPVVIYEASRLLSDYPLLNAYFTGEQIATYKEINIGFAIDVDKGLKVLKIAGAAQKNIREIERTIIDLSGRYLDDELQIDDLSDITFTITDLSSEGVAFFRPLINKMNSSILGLSSIDEKMQRFILSLTFDHRVTEGKSAARFLKDLKERLESYRSVNHLHQDITCFKCFKTLKEDLSGTGFARCITPEGKEGYICQSCLKGF